MAKLAIVIGIAVAVAAYHLFIGEWQSACVFAAVAAYGAKVWVKERRRRHADGADRA
jgi:hypothetical protein